MACPNTAGITLAPTTSKGDTSLMSKPAFLLTERRIMEVTTLNSG